MRTRLSRRGSVNGRTPRRAEGAAYGVDPEEYGDEDDFIDDLASAMAERLRGDSGAYARYGVNPEQYADEDERAACLCN